MSTDPRDLRIAELEHAVATRDTAIATLQATVTILLARIEDLEDRLNRNSSNSSTPPSANPPGAPKTTTKKPSGRKPGGQPGHKGTHRSVVDNPDRIVPHLPGTCRHCHTDFRGDKARVGKPIRHQVTDIPPVRPVVIEHQLIRCRCENCGKTTRAELPVGVGRGQFGPRLTALVAMLGGRYRLTRRELRSVLGDAFGLRLSVGSVQALCEQAAHALEAPYREMLAEPVVHLDETGWRHRGKKAWLWTVSSRKGAVFKLHRGRGHEARRAILPDGYSGVVASDRWSAYGQFESRGICHAHLLRNWRAISERKHPGAKAAGK
jgi:transposase